MFSFIDDLTAFSYGREFKHSFKEIYPPEPVIKKNLNNNEGLFWANLLKLKLINFSSSSMIREMIDCPISQIKIPYLRSSIPSNVFYSTNVSEILRNTRITSSKHIFLSNSKDLITRICKQGRRIKTFSHILLQTFRNRFQTCQKFFLTSSNFTVINKVIIILIIKTITIIITIMIIIIIKIIIIVIINEPF